MSPVTRRLGWIPDHPDHRDKLYQVPEHAAVPGAHVDLRTKCPVIYDQSDLGSCTANAIAAAVQFDRMRQHAAQNWIPSRLFIYYNERAIERTINSDSGATLRDGIKVIASQGDCPESEWPYIITRFSKRPATKCYRDAVRYKAVQYQRIIPTIANMTGCLASGFPFIFGFSVYDSFLSDEVCNTGIVNMPGPDEALQGGHAVMAVGYDSATQRFIVRNSWGLHWGMDGYFTMPYAYLTNSNLADDFWTVRLIFS